jgi:hypothetical protein
MTNEEKIEKAAIVKKYLQGLFPGCDGQTKWDFDSGDLLFRIDEADGQIKHRGKFTYEFLDDIKIDNIPSELDRRKLRSQLSKAGKNEVLIKS